MGQGLAAEAKAAVVTPVVTPVAEAVVEPVVAAVAGPVVEPAVERMVAEAVAPRKVIVFSMWHGVLKMVQKTLTRNGVRSVWCEGTTERQQASLETFKEPSFSLDGVATGGVDVLLMSAQSAAAGANLQAASHVVLLDPPVRPANHPHLRHN